jgi:hypothetical protein
MTYTIHDAHRDGRHASTNPEDRGFWISVGCTGCAAALPGEVPATEVEVTWEFEAADPEVGFLTDSITHTCAGNLDDAEPATIVDTHVYPSLTPGLVNQQTVFGCPVCSATTSIVEQWPAEWFEEPGR